MTTTAKSDLATPTQAKLFFAGTDDLLTVDVNALDGEQLSISVLRAQGWRNVRYLEFTDRVGGIPPNEEFFVATARPDRDTDAAVSLLNEGVERWGGVQIAADMEEWERGGLYDVGFYDTVYSGLAPFCVAVCRAYLLAWQASHNEVVDRAERKAEREQEQEGGAK